MFRKSINALACVVSLGIGALIYVLFGNGTYIFDFVQSFLSFETVALSDELSFMRFYFADYPWALSLACSLVLVFGEGSRRVILAVSISVAFGIIWEIFQELQVVNGTSDIWDVVAYFVAGVTAIIINLKEFER